MKAILLLTAATGLCLGCHKAKPSAADMPVAPPPPTAPVSAASSPSAGPTGDGLVPTESDIGLAALNKAVSAYTIGMLKEPQTLDEVVKAGFIKKIPAAPPGKKFALNANKTGVVLVTQ